MIPPSSIIFTDNKQQFDCNRFFRQSLIKLKLLPWYYMYV